MLEDLEPLAARDTLFKSFVDGVRVVLSKVDAGGMLDIRREFLIGLVVPMIERTSFQANNAGESVHVINSCGSSDLGSETMPSNSSIGDLVGVHKSHDIVGHILNRVRC